MNILALCFLVAHSHAKKKISIKSPIFYGRKNSLRIYWRPATQFCHVILHVFADNHYSTLSFNIVDRTKNNGRSLVEY